MSRSALSRAAAGAFAAVTLILVVRFVWVLLRTVAERGESRFLPEFAGDFAVLLVGIVSLGGIVASLLLAFALSRRGPEVHTGDVLLFLTASALAVGTQVLPAAEVALAPDVSNWWSRVPFAGSINIVAFLVSGVSYVRFTARFPVPLSLEGELGPLGRLSAVRSLSSWAWTCLLFTPVFLAGRPETMGVGILGFGWGFLVFLGTLTGLVGLGLFNLKISVQTSDREAASRARLVRASTLVFGISIGLSIGFAFVDAPDPTSDAVLGLGYLAHILLLGLAILIYGAVDPHLAVRRSAVATFLGLLGVFTFAGLEGVLSDLVVGVLGLPDIASSFLAGGLVVAGVAAWRLKTARDGE